MHRLVVALLAAFDALIAVAVGIVVIAAPLTLFWATSLDAPWSMLWPTIAKLWQLGNLVPLVMHLPAELLVATGIPPEAGSFVLSLAPLGFAAFAALFAARSGRRAAHSGAWFSGVISGGFVFAALGALVWITSRNGTAAVWGWQSLLFPALLYGIPLLVGALIGAWREGDNGGLIDRAHDWVDAQGDDVSELPSIVARGAGIMLAGLIALGALAVLVSIITRGVDIIGLFQSARVDVWGAVLLTLAHLAYLPTLVVWGASWIAGPGFTVGTGSSLTPVGTDTGVLPGLPILGLLPEHTQSWMLAVVLLPIAVAVIAGWAQRARFVQVFGDAEPFLPRVITAGVTALVVAGVAAVAAVLAHGSIGPGRLADVGPHAGWVALAVGIETLIGVSIMLLSPRGRAHAEGSEDDTKTGDAIAELAVADD